MPCAGETRCPTVTTERIRQQIRWRIATPNPDPSRMGKLQPGATRRPWRACNQTRPAGSRNASFVGVAPSFSPTLLLSPVWLVVFSLASVYRLFSRKWCNLGCNLAVIIESGQLTPRYGSSRDCSRRFASLPALSDPLFMVRYMVSFLVLALVSSCRSLVRRFPIPPPEFLNSPSPVPWSDPFSCPVGVRFALDSTPRITLFSDRRTALPPLPGAFGVRCSQSVASSSVAPARCSQCESRRVLATLRSFDRLDLLTFAGARSGVVTRRFCGTPRWAGRGGPRRGRKVAGGDVPVAENLPQGASRTASRFRLCQPLSGPFGPV